MCLILRCCSFKRDPFDKVEVTPAFPRHMFVFCYAFTRSVCVAYTWASEAHIRVEWASRSFVLWSCVWSFYWCRTSLNSDFLSIFSSLFLCLYSFILVYIFVSSFLSRCLYLSFNINLFSSLFFYGFPFSFTVSLFLLLISAPFIPSLYTYLFSIILTQFDFTIFIIFLFLLHRSCSPPFSGPR